MVVLSIFPGIGLLDRAFEAEGYCCVRGPDVIWGGDIRAFHPPPGHFEGVIGGDPCQSHGPLSGLIRSRGFEPSFPDMTREFLRVIAEAQPEWFLRENVPGAAKGPRAFSPAGYSVSTFILDNAWLGQPQRRTRRFWFGWDKERGEAPNLKAMILGAGFRKPRGTRAVTVPTVTGGSNGSLASREGSYASPPRTVEEMLALQGFPVNLLDDCPLTVEGKRRAVGNGVPFAMGSALARAIRMAMSKETR